jgi:hypothetical protein
LKRFSCASERIVISDPLLYADKRSQFFDKFRDLAFKSRQSFGRHAQIVFSRCLIEPYRRLKRLPIGKICYRTLRN